MCILNKRIFCLSDFIGQGVSDFNITDRLVDSETYHHYAIACS